MIRAWAFRLSLSIATGTCFIYLPNYREIKSNDFIHQFESRGDTKLGYEMALAIWREGSRATEVLLYRTSRLQVRLCCRTPRLGI